MKSKNHSEYEVPCSPQQVAELFVTVDGYDDLEVKVVLAMEATVAELDHLIGDDVDQNQLTVDEINDHVHNAKLMLGHAEAAINRMARISPSRETGDVCRKLLDRIAPIYESLLAVNEGVANAGF